MRQLKIIKSITNRSEASLDKYLVEIGKIDMLTSEDEISLARKIKEGDQKALERLTKANLRFVVSVAKQYQSYGMSLPDLINEGNVGLIKAAQRFDETRGFKFISYAVWWIRQSILQAIAEQARIVRLPLNRIGTITKINKQFAVLEQEFEREPSINELAEALDLSVSDVHESMSNSNHHVSMDSPLPNMEDDNKNMYDVLFADDNNSPETGLISESLKKEIERVLTKLSYREAAVVRSYYGLNNMPEQTFEEIAQKFDLTRERVRQIKEKAIRRLKHVSRNKILLTYLG